MSPLTGTHRLILACKKECEVDFELQPGIVETTKHKDTMSSTIGWTIRYSVLTDYRVMAVKTFSNE